MKPGRTAVAAALAVVLTGSTFAWFIAAYDSDRRDRGDAASGDAALETLDRRAAAIAQLLAGAPEALAVLLPSEVPAVLSVSTQPGAVATNLVGSPPRGVDTALLLATARTALEVSRDTGTPQAGPVIFDVVPLVVAVLPKDTSVSGTADRRRRAIGWRIALLSPTGLLAGLPDTHPSARAIRIDGVLLGRPGTPGHQAGTVLVGGQPWTLFMARTSGPLSRGALGTLVVALLGGLACLVADIPAQRALDRARKTTAAVERETRTVAELGPLLQSSLNLAEVLPAVALRLGDEFGLSRFSVQLVGERGELIDVFALGRTRDDVDEIDISPGNADELPAGVPGCLPLLRAGRTIGRLSLTAHALLRQPQLAALSAASDLIAVASYNVELFEREQASVRRLRDLDQLKDAFLSTISHELRTPLTAISGFILLLRDRWDEVQEEQRKEFLERVHRNTLSLGLLIDDLLDFARLEQQVLNAPPTPMNLDRQVEKTLAQLLPVLGSREIVSELQPVRALVNAGALERVLANLLTNAAKFSPPDSVIAVSVRADGDHAMVEVADQGPGIAPEDRERVFARFYRGESDAARGTRGAGIGLSVVRELVHQMGGSVAAMPNTPRGTRMVVRLSLEATEPSSLNGPALQAERSPV